MASAVEQGKNKKWHMFRVGQNYGPTAKTISQLNKTISLKITNSMLNWLLLWPSFQAKTQKEENPKQ